MSRIPSTLPLRSLRVFTGCVWVKGIVDLENVCSMVPSSYSAYYRLFKDSECTDFAKPFEIAEGDVR